MYIFEVISDCHLTPEQISTHKDSFMKIFAQTLTDRDIQVKVASLKATTAFLTSVDDSETALAYMEIIPHLLNTVVEALQTNEEQGKVALESMVDLTNTHPEIFKNMTGQLINVISQVMTQKNFEDGTRSSATEIILALANQMPASLRKADETRSMLIPSLVSMLTEVDDDMETWASTPDVKESNAVDPYNTAINAFNRLSVDLGEKTILSACTPIIKTCIQSADWKQR
jgi:importin-5